MTFPAELTSVSHWLLWRNETRDGKPTKVPYRGHSPGAMASVTDPNHWTDYGTAMAVVERDPSFGVGFVFKKELGLTACDLDGPKDQFGNPLPYDDVTRDRYQKIMEAFNSYTELSPSGHGVHIIAKGTLPAGGGRREGVEMYCDGRFFTMTGRVLLNVPIREAQDVIDGLWEDIQRGRSSVATVLHSNPETKSDAELLAMASGAKNGAQFLALYNGEWQGGYTSQSEADQALMNMIAFYSDNVEQVERIFLASALGQRSKANRADYIRRTLVKSWDQKIATRAAEEYRLRHLAANPVPEIPVYEPETEADTFTIVRPPGLMGAIADFIYAAAPRPVPEMAVASSIALMAGICGKAFNVSASGLNFYILLLAESGRGKEQMASGIGRLMEFVMGGDVLPSARIFLGPAQIASAPALFKHLETVSRSFMSIIGEFGYYFKKMTDRANTNDEALIAAFLDVYQKSGQHSVVREVVYSKREGNTIAIKAPAVTLLGESTPDIYYQTLDEKMIATGLVPRFMIIEYKGKRVPENPHHASARPSPELVNAMRDLCALAMRNISHDKVTDIEYEPDAHLMQHEYGLWCDDQINDEHANQVQTNLWNRAQLMVNKLAGLAAVSENWIAPKITVAHVVWAKGLVTNSMQKLLRKFELGEVGSDETDHAQLMKVRKAAEEWFALDPNNPQDRVRILQGTKTKALELHKAGIVPAAWFSRRLLNDASFKKARNGATNAINTALKTLCDNGELSEQNALLMEGMYGTKQRSFTRPR